MLLFCKKKNERTDWNNRNPRQMVPMASFHQLTFLSVHLTCRRPFAEPVIVCVCRAYSLHINTHCIYWFPPAPALFLFPSVVPYTALVALAQFCFSPPHRPNLLGSQQVFPEKETKISGRRCNEREKHEIGLLILASGGYLTPTTEDL